MAANSSQHKRFDELDFLRFFHTKVDEYFEPGGDIIIFEVEAKYEQKYGTAMSNEYLAFYHQEIRKYFGTSKDPANIDYEIEKAFADNPVETYSREFLVYFYNDVKRSFPGICGDVLSDIAMDYATVKGVVIPNEYLGVCKAA